MARTAVQKEIHSSDLPIEQKKSISDDPSKYEGDIVVVDKMPTTDQAKELAFMEEPVTVRLEPSAEKNAATTFPVWVNGKPAEVFQNGRWMELGYLPIGMPFTTKRKYLEVIVRAKIDKIDTEVKDKDSETPNNVIKRFTIAASAFSVLEDKNPRGASWLQELRRRNF